MKQEIVKSFGLLSNLGTNVVGGLTLLETVLGVVHVPKLKVEVDLLALLTGNTAYQNGRLLLSDRRDSVRGLTQQGRELIMITRDMLKPRFGSQFSNTWEILGYKNSLAGPTSAEDVKVMLEAIRAYFEANPTLEVPTLGITAANAASLLTDLKAAIVAVNLQDATVGTLRDTRDLKMDTLMGTLRDLVDELGLKLGPLDQRWKAFGLNMPGAEATPDAPEGVKVTLIGPTAAALKWNAAARAQYYRVWMKVHGVEGDYLAVGSPADLDFTIENLPANSTIDIVVTALNDGGESPVSEVVTVTTH